jgi:hypothetical protein
MKQLLLACLVILAFSNCNNTAGGWTSQERQKAMSGCIESATTAGGGNLDENAVKNYCSCILEKAMKKYPTYAQAEKGSEQDGLKLASDCKEALTGGGNTTGDDDNNGKKKGGLFGGGGTGGEWSMADQNNFVNPCAAGLVAKGYDQDQARQLCNCALGKLQKKYSSLRQADTQGGAEAGRAAMQACLNDQNGGNDNDN